MTDLLSLADAIESAEAGSRELSDRMLLALGWVRDGRMDTVWCSPNGGKVWEDARPHPTQDRNAIAEMEKKLLQQGYLKQLLISEHQAAVFWEKRPREFWKGEASGQDAECRARSSALLRAMAAA